MTGLEPPGGSDDDAMQGLAIVAAFALALLPWLLAWLVSRA